jgi:hypothetical protein
MTRLVSQALRRNFRTPRKTLQSLQLSKRRIRSLSSERPSETPGYLLVSNINNDAFNHGSVGFQKSSSEICF